MEGEGEMAWKRRESGMVECRWVEEQREGGRVKEERMEERD